MARGYRRRIEETAQRTQDGAEIPDELQSLAGPFGPYVRQDKVEFHHLGKEAQEWLLRMSAEDVADQKGAVSDYKFRQAVRKWALRVFWAATTGFGAVYVAGERLFKFLQFIGGGSFSMASVGQALKGWLGL